MRSEGTVHRPAPPNHLRWHKQEKGYKDNNSEERRRQRHERQIEWSNRLQDAMKEHAFTGSHPDLSDLPQWCMQVLSPAPPRFPHCS